METVETVPQKSWPRLSLTAEKIRIWYQGPAGLVIFFSMYATPIVLLLSGVIPRSYAHDLLFIFLPVMFVYGRLRRFSFLKLGFSPHWERGLKENVIFSGIAIAGIALLYLFKIISTPLSMKDGHFFIFYVCFSCPAQAFLYLSIPFAELERRGFSKNTYIIVSALNFCFLHAFFRDWPTMIVTFAMGLIWGFIYSRYQNFWGCAISHIVLGVLSILVGLI
jgi:membrane protease YdiL (CAAX protease family)